MAMPLNKWLESGLVASKCFMSLQNLHLNPQMSHSTHTVVGMHLVVYGECPLVHIWWPFHIIKSPNYEHIFVYVAGISKQIFKAFVIMSKVCTPMPLEVRVAGAYHIMEITGKIQVQVNEKSFVGHHNRIIHKIHLLQVINHFVWLE